MTPIVMALSGGVDSCVAAWLLSRSGHRLIGVSMQLWDTGAGGAGSGGCCSPSDFNDARRVAALAGFPYYVLDFESAFTERVVQPFAREYAAGRTPNPCVECNRHLKFGALLEAAERLGAERLATGHYARVERDRASGARRLRRARDLSKDQSYFLYMLGQRELERVMFPVGDLIKEQVREVARAAGLGVADKPDSQDLCFLAGRDRLRIVSERLGEDAEALGPIVSTSGVRLGTHRGLARYTVGQRRGLGHLPAGPWYVVRLEEEGNRVVVGREGEQYSGACALSEVRWVAGEPPPREIEAQVKIRHSHAAAEARVIPLGRASARVQFRSPQCAVTPGQAAVFYDGEWVLGGGRIEAAQLA
jgi:tRNA-specific 2-thiouridylase